MNETTAIHRFTSLTQYQPVHIPIFDEACEDRGFIAAMIKDATANHIFGHVIQCHCNYEKLLSLLQLGFKIPMVYHWDRKLSTVYLGRVLNALYEETPSGINARFSMPTALWVPGEDGGTRGIVDADELIKEVMCADFTGSNGALSAVAAKQPDNTPNLRGALQYNFSNFLKRRLLAVTVPVRLPNTGNK